MEFIAGVIDQGGLLVWPLVGLLAWGIIIMIIKWAQLRRARTINPDVIDKVEQLLLNKKMPEATAYCKQNSVPMTRILLAGIPRLPASWTCAMNLNMANPFGMRRASRKCWGAFAAALC